MSTMSNSAARKGKSTLLPTQPEPEVLPDLEEDSDAEWQGMEQDEADEDEDMVIDPTSLSLPPAPVSTAAAAAESANALSFAPLASHAVTQTTQSRKVAMPPHRLTPLKRDWVKIYTPLVEECGLNVRMNPKKRMIELKVRACPSVRNVSY